MTELPIHHTNDDGSRYYIRTDPATGEEQHYWSVTTALSIKDKSGLKRWAAMLAARRAMDNIPKLLRAQRIEPCERTWHRTEPLGCGECPPCVQKWVQNYHYGESSRRALEGSAVHDGIEAWIKTGVLPNAATLANLPAAGGGTYIERHPDITKMLPPYLERTEQWIADYGLRPDMFFASEMTVYNHTHRYAGTSDGGLRLEPVNERAARLVARIRGDLRDEPVLMLIDCKSREGEDKKLYDDHPLQLAAYRRAETCRPSKAAEREFPMPTTEGALVFQPRPDGYTFEPVSTGEEEFQAFLAALRLHRWTVDHGPASIAVKTYPLPDGWVWPRPAVPAVVEPESAPPAKKTARKRATKKVAAAPAAEPDPAPVAQPALVQPGSMAVPPRIVGATLESMTRMPASTLAGMPPHPDSPFNDPIPF